MDDHRLSAITQYSDSPSVYAHPFDDYPSPVSAGPPPRHAPTSMLDFEDDSRTSYPDPLDADNDDEDAPHDDIPPAARLSYLGPKMRFHSRAPWEMDGGALDEEDEGEDSHHLGSGLPFARAKHGSSSPRPSFQTSRASGESSRSHIPPKRSFETINSQIAYPLGALYTLAHESMSATALARPREALRSKFSLGRLRPDTPTGPLPPLPPASPARSRLQPSPPPFDNAHQSMHPYANPDHAGAYADEDDRTSFPNSLYSPSRNDSSMTVTETFSGDSLSRTSMRSAAAPTLTPDTSLSSLAPRPRAATISAKKISAPVPVSHPPEPDRNQDHQHLHPHGLPLGTSLPGWHERGKPPAFSLISLEEARAQRMRSATAASDAPRTSGSSGTSQQQAHMSVASFEDGETASIATDTSPFGSYTSRARGRSISAGAKAKSALHTIVGQPKSEHRKEPEPQLPSATPQGKTLKHKKSGFMRLFNGGKAQERDEESSTAPPPVPALPEYAQQRPAKAGVQRIPVPSLSPSLAAAAAAAHPDDDAWSAGVRSPKRVPPTLSITTAPRRAGDQNQQPFPASTSAAHAYAAPWTITADPLPQSAPANASSFPALRLRPVSTLFSAHFGDHIVPLDDDEGDGARSSGDTDADGPEPALVTPRSTSPGALTSPLTTPASFLRASGEHVAIVDGGALSAALQGQLAGAKPDAQRIWELEGRVRDLQAELQKLRGRNGDAFCVHCGRGKKPSPHMLGPTSVVNRPRARTGTSSRFGSVLP